MKRCLVFLLLAGSAYAQAPVVPPTPEAQALAQKLMAEINGNIQCSATVITLQQQLAAAQARVKALTEKYEPKTTPKADAPVANPK